MMTIEEAKKELREYRDNIKYIEEKQNDAEELKSRIEKITSNITGLPSGKGQNLEKATFEESLDRIKQIEAECNKKLQELLLKKYIVENKIEQLEQPYKSTLYLRYIRGKDLKIIAKDMAYSHRHMCRLHGEALIFYSKL